MVNVLELEEVVHDQRKYFLGKDTGVEREMDLRPFLKSSQIVAITGVRRCGKSTLLRQIARHLDSFYYLNFDDERLFDFQVADFQKLMIVFQKAFVSKNILLDEIQNISGWERFIRRLHDETDKIFLTGSNARLLSSEFATHLTGRDQRVNLYPFSFSEYLKWKGLALETKTSEGRAQVLRELDEYLVCGGFPERLKQNDPEVVQRLYEGILYRDIVSRFHVRETKALEALAHYLFSNFATQISYHGLQKVLPFKSAMTVRSHVGHMQDAWLIFELQGYDPSLKKQYNYQKKVYVIDNGMRHAVSFSASSDRGRYLENLIFLELKRRRKEVFFYQTHRECDFVIRQGTRVVEVIQSCLEMNSGNESREIEGLLNAMRTFKLSRGTILTLGQEETRNIKEFRIDILPVWKWLLNVDVPHS